MKRTVVVSFWVHRPKAFPNAPPYLDMLRILDASCRRVGMEHVVLTDETTAPQFYGTGLTPYLLELPAHLMRATTEAHARWIESPYSKEADTVFVGADCLVLRDFRPDLPACDMAIAFMRHHKRWRLNNGFVYVPAESREKVARVLRLIADDTREKMFDDMLAIERALVPMPEHFGEYARRGLTVGFLPLPIWNRYMAVCKETPDPLSDKAEGANVLHFMGGHDNGKQLYFDWAKAHGFG